MFPRLSATPAPVYHVRCPPPSAFSAGPPSFYRCPSPDTKLFRFRNSFSKFQIFQIPPVTFFLQSRDQHSHHLLIFTKNIFAGFVRWRKSCDVINLPKEAREGAGGPLSDLQSYRNELDKNRIHPKNFISGDFSFLAFEWAPFGSFGSIWT